MKKYQLALLMILPLALFSISGFLRWYEHQLLNPHIERREAIRQLQERALHPEKELDPYARITQLSEILINVDAAMETISKSIAEMYRVFVDILELLALLQIGLSIYLFRNLKGTPNPTPHSDAREASRSANESGTRAGGRER